MNRITYSILFILYILSSVPSAELDRVRLAPVAVHDVQRGPELPRDRLGVVGTVMGGTSATPDDTISRPTRQLRFATAAGRHVQAGQVTRSSP